jgi:hypothetical protein
MMAVWSFYDFRDGRGINLIREWLDSLPVKARAKINARILFMRAIPVWPEQYISSLKGWPELVELRVVSGGGQYRPLGFYGPHRHEFTIVLGAIEKGKLPRRVLETADDNRKIVLADRSRTCEHEFDKGPDA